MKASPLPSGPVLRLSPLPLAAVPAEAGADGLTVQPWGLLIADESAGLEVHLEPNEMAALGLVLIKLGELRGADLAAAFAFLTRARTEERRADA